MYGGLANWNMGVTGHLLNGSLDGLSHTCTSTVCWGVWKCCQINHLMTVESKRLRIELEINTAKFWHRIDTLFVG